MPGGIRQVSVRAFTGNTAQVRVPQVNSLPSRKRLSTRVPQATKMASGIMLPTTLPDGGTIYLRLYRARIGYASDIRKRRLGINSQFQGRVMEHSEGDDVLPPVLFPTLND